MSSPPDRATGAPCTVPELASFRFDGVERAGTRGGPPPRAGPLTLTVDGQGLEATGAPWGDRIRVTWSDVDRVSLGVTTPGPFGSTTPFEVEGRGGILRFVIHSEAARPVRIAAFDEQLARWSTAPGVPSFPLDGPDGWHGAPPPVPAAPAGRRSGTLQRRPRRRVATLVTGIALVAAGIALAAALPRSVRPATRASAVRTSPDQRLAQGVLLTLADLPAGWRSAPAGAGAESPLVQHGQAEITAAFARCMGISDDQAAVLLGGRAADQTAEAASPVFVAPASASRPGIALELQSAVSVVRTRDDERHDLSLTGAARYAGCDGAAVAAEVQLGVDGSSGGAEQPGPASVTVVELPAPAGEQRSALLFAFTVADGAAPVPVEVEVVSLGQGRVESALEVCSIGGQIPAEALATPLSVIEQRVADGDRSRQV